MSALSISIVVRLAAILEAAQRGSKVRWTPDGGETILEGVARSIGREDFTFIGGEDVRDAFLRVTGTTGREHALPVATILEWQEVGAIAFHA